MNTNKSIRNAITETSAIFRMGAKAITRISTKEVDTATAISFISLPCTAKAAAIPPKQAIATRSIGAKAKRFSSNSSRNSDKRDFVFSALKEMLAECVCESVFIVVCFNL